MSTAISETSTVSATAVKIRTADTNTTTADVSNIKALSTRPAPLDMVRVETSGAIDPIEIDSTDIDLAFATVPRIQRHSRPNLRTVEAYRSTVDRRPLGARPRSAVELYERGPVRTPAVRRPLGGHPQELVEQAQVGFAVLAIAALLSALVVTALIGLAHLRAGTFGDDPAGPAPTVVEEQSTPGFAPNP